MKKVLTFGQPLNQTTAFMAGSKQFAFPFSVVDSDLIGTPEEQPATKHHCITVKVSDVKVVIWGLDALNKPYTEKVLFRFGSKYVAEKIRTNSLPDKQQIVMPTITNHTHPDKKLPFDPTRVSTPNGSVESLFNKNTEIQSVEQWKYFQEYQFRQKEKSGLSVLT